MKLIEIDLDEIIRDLGVHFDGDKTSLVKACPHCGEIIEQWQNECYGCDTPVVWTNSDVWYEEFGSPKLRIKQLKMVNPTTETGQELIESAGEIGFANKQEDKDWARAERLFGKTDMRNIISYACSNKKGRGAISHALAIARKKVREYSPLYRPNQNVGNVSVW